MINSMISMVTLTDDDFRSLKPRHQKTKSPRAWFSETIGFARLVAAIYGETEQAKQMDHQSGFTYFARGKPKIRSITMINPVSQ